MERHPKRYTSSDSIFSCVQAVFGVEGAKISYNIIRNQTKLALYKKYDDHKKWLKLCKIITIIKSDRQLTLIIWNINI